MASEHIELKLAAIYHGTIVFLDSREKCVEVPTTKPASEIRVLLPEGPMLPSGQFAIGVGLVDRDTGRLFLRLFNVIDLHLSGRMKFRAKESLDTKDRWEVSRR